MCNDVGGRCCNREFQYQVIVGVFKERSPCKKHLLMLGHEADSIQNPMNLILCETWNKARAEQNTLILQNKCHRHRNMEMPGANGLDDLEAGATLGAKSRHQNRCVEDCKHARYHRRYRMLCNLFFDDVCLNLNFFQPVTVCHW